MSLNARKVPPKVANFEVVLRDVNQTEVQPIRNSSEKKPIQKTIKKIVEKHNDRRSGKYSSLSVLRTFNTKPVLPNRISGLRHSRSVDNKSSDEETNFKFDPKPMPVESQNAKNDQVNENAEKLNSLNLAESEGLLINVLRKSAPTGYDASNPTPTEAAAPTTSATPTSTPSPPIQQTPRILQRPVKQNVPPAVVVDQSRKRERDLIRELAKEKEKAKALDLAQQEKELVQALDQARKEQAEAHKKELEEQKMEQMNFMTKPTLATVAGTFKHEEFPKSSTQHFRDFASKLKLPTTTLPTNYRTTKNNATTIHIRKDLKECLESKVLILHTSVEDIHKIGKIILKDAKENREIFLRPKMKRRKGAASKA